MAEDDVALAAAHPGWYLFGGDSRIATGQVCRSGTVRSGSSAG